MSAECLTVGLIVILAFSLAGLRPRRGHIASPLFAVSPRVVRMGWVVLGIWYAVNLIPFEERGLDRLMSEGLSTRNIVQIITVVILSSWAIWALAVRRVRLAYLTRGPAFWMSVLGCVYLVSTLWSVWPAYTAYRALEFLAVWIGVVAALSSPQPWRNIPILSLLVMGGELVRAAIYRYQYTPEDAGYFSLLRSNLGAPVAAVYILFMLAAGGYTFRQRVVRITLAGVVFFLFGSTATLVALAIAFPMLFLRGLRPRLRMALSFVAIPLALPLLSWSIIVAGDPAKGDYLAGLLGKGSPTSLLSASGRLPLWKAIWDDSGDQPFGRGYAAYERMYSTTSGFADRSEGWGASSAHNGFLSAWMGGGWLALTAVVFLFGSLLGVARQAPQELRGFAAAAVTLLAINNLTIQGVGSYANPVLMLVMVLAVLLGQAHGYGPGSLPAELTTPAAAGPGAQDGGGAVRISPVAAAQMEQRQHD